MSRTSKLLAGVGVAIVMAGSAAIAIPSFAQDAVAPVAPAAAAPAAAAVEAVPAEAATPVTARTIRIGGPGIAGDLFETFDADGDGSVTQAEIDAARGATLAEFDANGDGSLSLDEYIALLVDQFRERLVDAFQALDNDGDAIITAEEFNAGFADIVERLDQDGDGALSEADRAGRMIRLEGPRGGGLDIVRPAMPGVQIHGSHITIQRPGPGQDGPRGEDGPRGFFAMPFNR